jgi:peptidoglycan hydrolase CwlO-like protein
MLTRMEAKERLIKDYQLEADELRRQLVPFEAGEQRTFENRIETTEEDIAQLKSAITEYERCIVVLEKQVREKEEVDY